MKQFSVIVLIAGLFGQTFSRYIIVLDYQLNKAYIAKNLCVNRDKPEMKCEGKCYLCKRLKKEDKKDQENPERKPGVENQPLFSPMDRSLGLSNIFPTSVIYARSASDNRTVHASSFCFHPPD